LITQYDSSIGYRAGKKIHLHEGAWDKISALVKRETGFNLRTDTIDAATIEDGLNSVLHGKLSPSGSTNGFVMCRLIGSPYEVCAATANVVQQPTPANTYLGLHIDDIKQWQIKVVIIVESFMAFMALDDCYLEDLKANQDFSMVLIIYRGYENRDIYHVATELAKTTASKYIFPDYDLAGLSLAEAVASRMNATGYILPFDAQHESRLVSLSKREEYDRQSATAIYDQALMPSYKDIKRRLIATSQDAIMAHGIPVGIVNRHAKTA
jgi:hypothetical protein